MCWKAETLLCLKRSIYSSLRSSQWSCMVLRPGPERRWSQKNWYFQNVMLENTPARPLDSKEIKLASLKGNHPWILIGREKLKLKFQNFDYLMLTANSLEKSLILGQIEGRKRKKREKSVGGWDGWMAKLMQLTWTWENFGRGTWKLVWSGVGSQRVWHTWVTEQQ